MTHGVGWGESHLRGAVAHEDQEADGEIPAEKIREAPQVVMCGHCAPRVIAQGSPACAERKPVICGSHQNYPKGQVFKHSYKNYLLMAKDKGTTKDFFHKEKAFFKAIILSSDKVPSMFKSFFLDNGLLRNGL